MYILRMNVKRRPPNAGYCLKKKFKFKILRRTNKNIRKARRKYKQDKTTEYSGIQLLNCTG